jgi:phosphatidylinositol alpha-1,6-mannosyltransferase
MVRARVTLGVESLRRGASGIARVARLVARVLGDEVRAGRLQAQAIVLNDDDAATDLGIPVRTMRGSRAAFVSAMHLAAASTSHFIYDFGGIARAHPRVPPLRRPYMVWIHGIEIWEQARADRLRRAQRADVLVSNTDHTRTRAAALHAGLEHAQTCWLATEEDTAPDASVDPAPPTALVLARLDAAGGYKGHRELIEAWPSVLRSSPEARLVIAGDGPGMPVIRAWADASPARHRIELRGFVSEAALDRLWLETSLLAMPSRGEGFGLVYIEAMRRAVPVLASIHDAGTEVNRHGDTSYNVDLDAPGQLVERLTSLLARPDERRRLGLAARARWQAHFRYSAFAQRFRPLLHELLER